MKHLLLILCAFGFLLGFYVIASEARIAAATFAQPLTHATNQNGGR